MLRGALQRPVGEILKQLCEWKKLEVLENEYAGGSCAYGVINSSEVFSIRSSWVFNRKIYDHNIRQTSGTEETLKEETLLAKGYCVSTVSLDEEKVRQYAVWKQVKGRRMNK